MSFTPFFLRLPFVMLFFLGLSPGIAFACGEHFFVPLARFDLNLPTAEAFEALAAKISDEYLPGVKNQHPVEQFILPAPREAKAHPRIRFRLYPPPAPTVGGLIDPLAATPPPWFDLALRSPLALPRTAAILLERLPVKASATRWITPPFQPELDWSTIEEACAFLDTNPLARCGLLAKQVTNPSGTLFLSLQITAHPIELEFQADLQNQGVFCLALRQSCVAAVLASDHRGEIIELKEIEATDKRFHIFKNPIPLAFGWLLDRWLMPGLVGPWAFLEIHHMQNFNTLSRYLQPDHTPEPGSDS